MSDVLNQGNSQEPQITEELIRYLDATFDIRATIYEADIPTLHKMQGQQAMIDHLRALYASQNPES